MKLTILIFLLTTINFGAFAQVDKNGNPIFNSIQLSIDTLNEYRLVSNYYTVENNIDNEKSSVFVSKSPSLKEYLKFSIERPSYFFLLTKEDTVLEMIMLKPDPLEDGTVKYAYEIYNLATNKKRMVDCNVHGQFSEARVSELDILKIDTASQIIELPNGKGYVFNKKVYRIQPFNQMKKELISILNLTDKKEKLSFEQFVKSESIGGSLDFSKMIGDQEMFIFDGKVFPKEDGAIFLWGKAMKKMTFGPFKSVKLLWEDIYQRKLTKQELKILKQGYKS